ncbi:MAG TPA: ATP-binding protein [Dongiaceae bacterium]|nr:ATP-binding protein [Dongiaceae bacterium]
MESNVLAQFALVAATAATQALAILYLASCPNAHPAYRWWAIAFSGAVVRMMLLPFEVMYPGYLEGVGIWMINAFTIVTCYGSFSMIGRVPNRIFLLLIPIGLAWALFGQFVLKNLAWVDGPLAVGGGCIWIVTAVGFFRHRPRRAWSGYGLASTAFMLLGIHLITYPVARLIPWYLPIGYVIATVLSTLVAFAVVIIADRREAAINAALTAQLRESESAYREMLDNIPYGVYRTSPDGRLLRANRALAKMNGYDSTEDFMAAVAEEPTNIYVNPDHRDLFRKMALTEGAVNEFEAQVYRHRTGEVLWVLESGRAVRDARGNLLYFEGMLRDITQEKLDAEAKAIGDARLASIMEHAPFGIFMKSLDGVYLAANSASETLRSAGPLIGKRDSDFLSSAEAGRHAAEEARVMATGQPLFSERAIGDPVRPAWLLVVKFPVRRRDGTVMAIGGFELDVSAQKRAEFELITARDQATSANNAKSAFLANMSHELRTPLNAIIGFTEVLEREIFGTINERQRSYLKDIHQAGAHLLDVINDILDMSRIEAGKVVLSPEPVNVDEWITSCLHIVRERMIAAAQRLHLDIVASQDVCLVADRRALKQVLINLLSNAVKFTPAQGEITVRSMIEADGAFRVSVTDTGIGISQEALKWITEPFRQADPSIAKKYEGSGLGLPISKRLIELHGGRLEIESDIGAGTTVSIVLPKGCVLDDPHASRTGARNQLAS